MIKKFFLLFLCLLNLKTLSANEKLYQHIAGQIVNAASKITLILAFNSVMGGKIPRACMFAGISGICEYWIKADFDQLLLQEFRKRNQNALPNDKNQQ